MRRKTRAKAKDETPEEFFNAIKVPKEWRWLGNSSKATLGKLYQIKPGLVARLWFDTVNKRGGIGTRKDDWPRKPAYNCLVSNKQASGINEFLENYKPDEDEKEDTNA